MGKPEPRRCLCHLDKEKLGCLQVPLPVSVPENEAREPIRRQLLARERAIFQFATTNSTMISNIQPVRSYRGRDVDYSGRKKVALMSRMLTVMTNQDSAELQPNCLAITT